MMKKSQRGTKRSRCSGIIASGSVLLRCSSERDSRPDHRTKRCNHHVADTAPTEIKSHIAGTAFEFVSRDVFLTVTPVPRVPTVLRCESRATYGNDCKSGRLCSACPTAPHREGVCPDVIDRQRIVFARPYPAQKRWGEDSSKPPARSGTLFAR